MATSTNCQPFVEHLAEKVHNLGSDTLTVALTNTAPNATDATLSQITQIAYTNCSSRVLTASASSQTSGIYKLVLDDLTLTASGGSVGPFRYAVIYNDTPTSPADPLIGFYDYGSSITLAAGESLLLDFNASNGVLQID
jgi:hypothetical protein